MTDWQAVFSLKTRRSRAIQEECYMASESSGVPAVGSKAPSVALKSTDGKNVSLSDFKGKSVVLYFYPKDDTPGCTIEANEFQASIKDFEKANAVVVGVSPDSVESHCKFANKYGLNFILLADEEHAVAEKYGVWVEKNNYGKKYWGIQRATFLIDGDGKVAKVWPKVKAEGHAAEVLEAVKDLK
ncbi:MAG: thioredoxin-dependent thiol peroxidase [Candidatus Hydrogenedentes bacterium]|nr:thioredoxin-dependent thiol peroxidase [Candidatus Hydrogenedentota bacterium]